MHSLQIGITGGIGSGKSLISTIFKKLGVPVYDADSHARTLMTTDAILADQIKKEFGDASYKEDGSLDRSYLSSATFGKKDELEKLNSLVHPRVRMDYSNWTAENKSYPYVLREAALMFESKANLTVDKIIVVSAPEDIRIKRILLRDPQRSLDQIKAIINSQWSEEEKLKRADYIIINDDKTMVIPQVLKLHKEFLSVSKSNNTSISK